MVNLFDAVRVMILAHGTTPPASLHEANPLIGQCTAWVEWSTKAFQAERWWFNEEVLTLHPQADTGYILLADDVGHVDLAESKIPRVSARGNRLYNNDDNTDVWSTSQRVTVYRILEFDRLPVSAKVYAALEATVLFLNSKEAPATTVAEYKARALVARGVMGAENIRQEALNRFEMPDIADALEGIQGPYTKGRFV